MPNNRKICVIGSGNWGLNHIRTLDYMGNLGGVVDIDSNSLAKIKNQYKNINCHINLDESFYENYSGYIVATPAPTHYAIAKQILEHKHHVLIEKPVTLNSLDAIDLKDIAIKNKVNIMVGHLLLFHPAIKKIKDLINEGVIGKLQYIYSNRLNLGKIRSEENVFWSFAPHDISVLQYLIGDFPNKIYSSGGVFVQSGIHDTTISVLDYPNNVKAHIYLSWLHPFKEHRIVIIGSKGMITFEDSEEGKPLKLYDKSFSLGCDGVEKQDGDIIEVEYSKKMPLDIELEYFIDHLDGEPIKISDIDNGIEVIKILEKSLEGLE